MDSNETSRIITFHSYKGGAGRSSTTINTIPYLVKEFGADERHPILVLDMDLDSAGMTYLTNLDEHFRKNYDVKQFLIGSELRWSDAEADDVLEHNLIKKFYPIGDKLGVERGAVLFLGVNDGMKYDNTQMTGGKELLISKLRKFCRNNDLPAIVLDSASGDQFAAIMATRYATETVCCMRPTVQFRIGTFNYLTRHALENAASNYILLPTVVPMQDVEIDGEMQKANAVKSITRRVKRLHEETKEQGGRISVCTEFISEDMLGINEVQRFKWQEGVLYKIAQEQKLTADEEEACRRYAKLASVIKNIKSYI